MKKVLSFVLTIVMIFTLLAGFTGCSSPQQDTTNATNTDAKNESETATTDLEFIRLAASSPGGDYYTIGVPFCTLWEKYISGVSCTLLPGGGTANVKSVSSGEAEAGWTQSGTMVLAMNGDGPFDEPIKNLQMLFAIHPGTLHIATLAGSKVTTIEQMESCKIGLGPTGNTGNTLILSVMQEEYGITEDSIKAAGGTINYMDYSEAGDALKDGQIDVWVGLGPYPIYGISEVALNPGIALIQIDEDKIADYTKKHPNWSTTTISAGTYGSYDKDYVTLATWNIVVVRDTMSDDVAYAMTKAVFENLEQIWEVSATAKKFLNLDDALKGTDVVPVHPGAMKYYKEIGLTE